VLRVVRAFDAPETPVTTRIAATPPPPAPARAPAVYLAAACAPGDALLGSAQRELEKAGARVVTVDLANTPNSTAQVRHAEILGYAREPEDALRAYLRSRNDIGALLVVAPGGHAAAGLAAAQALPASVPRILVTDRALAGAPTDLTVLSAPLPGAGGMFGQLVAGAAQAIATAATRDHNDIQRMRRTQP
jgi:uncharacterized protein (UPF0261 family)